MKKKHKTIFLTGATGFVGANLGCKFLEKGYSLKLFARYKKEEAKTRVEKIMRKVCDKYEIWKDKIEVVEGDIAEENLGLSSNEISKLYSEVDIVFHCAANTSFDKDKKAEIERDNIIGTKNILELVRKLDNPNLHYMSTAYVCGRRKGIVYEDELDKGQTFNNPYEESKLKAEKLVRSYRKQYNIKTTIYRPAIIVGDSITGKTINFLGFYSLIRAMYLLSEIFKEDLKRNGKRAKLIGAYYKGNMLCLPLRVVGISNKTFNLVPINYVVDVIFEIFKKEDYYNKTYHLTNPTPPTIGHIQRLICDYFNVVGVKIVDPLEFQTNPMNQWEEFFVEIIKDFVPYLEKEEPIFSNKNIQEVLNPTNIKCPYITRNLISKLISYCIVTDWGRRNNESLFQRSEQTVRAN